MGRRRIWILGLLCLAVVLATALLRRHSYRVRVDYHLPPEAMIRAGNYSSISSDIVPKHGPITNISGRAKAVVEETTIELLHLRRPASTRDVLLEIERGGWRPASFSELLALGAQYPSAQERHRIVSVIPTKRARNDDSYSILCGGRRLDGETEADACSIPYLGGSPDGQRSLDLLCNQECGETGQQWNESDRFAVVKKAQPLG
jgi:hypothetical protein